MLKEIINSKKHDEVIPILVEKIKTIQLTKLEVILEI